MKLISRRTQSWLFFLASIGIIYAIITVDVRRLEQRTESAESDSHPTWILRDSHVQNFDDNGQISLDLTAAEFNYYSNDDTLKMRQPNIQIYDETAAGWTISANRGVLDQSSQELVFSNQVVAENSLSEQRLSTDTLVANLNTNQLSTDQKLFISAPYTKIEATGMTANWKLGTLELLADVNVQIQ